MLLVVLFDAMFDHMYLQSISLPKMAVLFDAMFDHTYVFVEHILFIILITSRFVYQMHYNLER